MSLTPASSRWRDDSASYFPPEHDAERLLPTDDEDDEISNLDRTLDTIGMGRYQYSLVMLCGFGWMADNMWLQAISIILPRVQRQFDVPDSHIGLVSSCMFTGMGVGALGWGACSDLMGRTLAFNATLFFTASFGVIASFAGSFPALCFLFFLLGTALGGSMVCDGTLLLEQLPRAHQYLLTALSVFFSFGAVLAAVIALLVVPKNSCTGGDMTCDVLTENNGWNYLLRLLGLVTLAMFIARMVFFRLHESPRYLVSMNRPEEALVSLQLISRYNGNELAIDIEDVSDTKSSKPSPIATPTVLFDAETGNFTPNYNSTDDAPTSLGVPPLSPKDLPEPELRPRPRPSIQRRPSSVIHQTAYGILPRWLHRPLTGWLSRLSLVLSPEWMRTTLIVWAIWCSMSLGFTMFNVYLPKLLEGMPTGGTGVEPKTIEDTLWDVVIFTSGGCPGAILGAYMVQSKLGRRASLAISTFVTAFFMVVFTNVESQWAVRASTVIISLSATAMWAVLYGWTPEIFSTSVRGSAVGIASALSRVGGMIAPVLGGFLLMVNRSIPVYTSVAIFFIAGVCVLALPEDAGKLQQEESSTTTSH